LLLHTYCFVLICIQNRTEYAFFVNLFNRLLPVGIALYRYVYVCRVSWVVTAAQRKNFNFFISAVICLLSCSLTFFSFLYREQNFVFLDCIGKAEYFHSQNKSSVRLFWLLPLYHPFHLLSIIAFFSYTFVVPLAYFRIYRFRKQQDSKVSLGLSDKSRKVRIRKNLVTTRTNLIIWIAEVMSGFLVTLPGSNVFVIAYIFVPNTVSPILYYVGIELNRQTMKTHFQKLFKESRRTGMRKTALINNYCFSLDFLV
jgi:hypothetical protein